MNQQEAPAGKSVVAAVDVGGTKIAAAAAAVDVCGKVSARQNMPTPSAAGPAAVLGAIADLVRRLTLDRRIVAVGVGAAGVIDTDSGTVLSATSALPAWAGIRLRNEVATALRLPVTVVNDVHAHAVGEHRFGSAAGHDTVVFITAGTGVGGSILVRGQPLPGAHFVAGHTGHVPVVAAAGQPCPCGRTGHVEAVASGPAMLAQYVKRTGRKDTTCANVASAAAHGDAIAGQILTTGARALGEAIGGIINVVDPDVVVVGGGVSRSGDAWWTALRASVVDAAIPKLADTPVLGTSLGDDTALAGAAELARQGRS